MASSSDSRGKKSYGVYLNTMIFSVVAAVLSLILLLLLLRGPPEMGVLSYMIITIELGLLFIVVQAVVRIHLYDRKMKKLAERSQNNIVVVDSCPDYWTLGRRGSTSVCTNQYVGPTTATTYTIAADKVTTTSPDGKNKEINVSSVGNRALKDVCQDLKTKYEDVAWSELRNKCHAYGQFV